MPLPLNMNPPFAKPGLPQVPDPIATSNFTQDTSRSNPEIAAKISHRHKIIYATVISICRLLAKAGLCGCGGRKFTGAGRVVDDGETRKRLSWMRLSSPPANFGPGCLIRGVGKCGRLYDEKGVERIV
jgi:hypothetical protein